MVQMKVNFYALLKPEGQLKELRNERIGTINSYGLCEIIHHKRSMTHIIKIEYELALPKESPVRKILIGNYSECWQMICP